MVIIYALILLAVMAFSPFLLILLAVSAFFGMILKGLKG